MARYLTQARLQIQQTEVSEVIQGERRRPRAIPPQLHARALHLRKEAVVNDRDVDIARRIECFSRLPFHSCRRAASKCELCPWQDGAERVQEAGEGRFIFETQRESLEQAGRKSRVLARE